MTASRIMETIPGEDGDLFELEDVRRPNREVRFDLTHANEDIEAHYNEPKHRHTLQRNNWSSSTQKVLSAMPSRSMKWNQAAAGNQSRSTNTQQRRPVSICTEDQDVFTDQDDYVDDELLKKLQGLSVGESAQLLREMALSVSEKRQMRELVVCWESGKPRSANRPLCLHWFQTCLKKVSRGVWSGRQKSLQLWQKVFKNISAHFGMGVLSYFIFLRRLLLFNLLLILINGLFLLLPQLSNPSTHSSSEAEHKFNPWMLTGMGILTNSVMFYGHYSDYSDCQTGSSVCFQNYNIPLAYSFTFGIGMFVTCVMLVYNMSKAFGKSQSSTTTRKLVLKVFCSWDFKVYKKRSVRLQSVNICTQLKEMLSELICKKQKRNLCSTLRWLSLHLLVWSICLLCMGACIFAVNYFHLFRSSIAADADPVRLLILPLAVSAYSHLLPVLFDMLSRVEQYNSPDIRIYVSIARNLLLKGCIFSALCYYWFGEIERKNNIQCWETAVGQELYRLILMDLIFEVLYILLAQFFWGFCVRNVTLRKRKLEFAIAQEVLELIYSQTLVWFGVLFSPLLPAVQIGKLCVLFYLKKTSLMVNFQAPRKHWRASQMSNLFIKLLFIPSFTGALACVIYVIWSVRPSSGCGPFRNLSMLLIIDQGKKSDSLNWLKSTYIHWVYNPLFLFLISGAFLAIIYIHMQVVDGQKVITGRLQKQINFEGEDKKFLIDKIQALNEPKSQH
ncbi:transmembrane channel-like protein 6 [Danio aesculapii]|uniref:transmembrane channel-like protein 6 n=1 Tax=Danio aesculapii TaxID=1142201 RepID=UPI0024BF9096|nr:transmembrane channel-like protein 6 [Danio aesculapii]